MEDPEILERERAARLVERLRVLLPADVAVEARQNTRWWVQISLTGPRDEALAHRVLGLVEDAGLTLTPRVDGPADDVPGRLLAGETLEVLTR